jgi:hypothetical protein
LKPFVVENSTNSQSDFARCYTNERDVVDFLGHVCKMLVPLVFGRDLQRQLVRKWSPERNAIGYTQRLKRSNSVKLPTVKKVVARAECHWLHAAPQAEQQRETQWYPRV